VATFEGISVVMVVNVDVNPVELDKDKLRKQYC
jgi:hypothetical protein